MVWDQVQTQDFLSHIQLPFGQSLADWHTRMIRPEATRLVAMLNEMENAGPGAQPQSEQYLRRLIVLSGEDFGTGFKGDEKKYTWTAPDSPEAWGETMNRVNSWADANLGTGFGQGPVSYGPGESQPGDNEGYSPGTNNTEPEPTYEPPPDNAPPSYSPKPDYTPPEPEPEPRDNGVVADPDYNSHDSYQPEGN